MIAPTLPADLDGLRLRAELAAATRTGWDKPANRAAAIGRLKRFLGVGRAHAASRLADSGGGLEAARSLAAITGALVRALFDSIAADHHDLGSDAPGLAVCATGGFGAGALGPQSDIDLVFLRGVRPPDGFEIIVERTVYALWDVGLAVGGGAVRTIGDAIELAQLDVSERTALLDLRLISGDAKLVRVLEERFDAHLRAGDAAAFVSAKLAERDARLEQQGNTRYAVEPNVKDGKGGLRDLSTLRWFAQVLYGADALERWVGAGLLSVPDVERFLRAEDFFWTVRFHLHDLNGRKDDRLTFDIQPEIARRMGYEDEDQVLAVERFMRDYFTRAIDVGALTRLVCAKLEADELKDLPAGAGRFMTADGPDPDLDALAEQGFALRAGRVDFIGHARVKDDPVLMLRLFETAAARHLDLHPDAVATVGQNLRLVDEDLRRDPRAARAFFAILLDTDDPQMALRAMTEAGLLGAFIPEFGEIVARTQFNMYHRYTVDEHTLNALGLLREIEQGKHPLDHPLSTQIAPMIQNRRALHLAVLLHDTGKGVGDQCVAGADRALAASLRLGLDEPEAELIAWLVRSHLDMSDAAQRRDLSDPRTVLDFAAGVRTLERLRLLTVLTVVDIRAVGPGVWNGWKAQLLRDLYSATAAVLKGGGRGDEQEARRRLSERADQARREFRAQMQRVDADFADRWSAQQDDPYWLAFSPEDRLRHASFVRSAEARGAAIAVGVRIDKRRSAAEVLVRAPDRHGLFADIAGALALEGANVVGAQVTTGRTGEAFDVFYVQEPGGRPFGWSDPRLRDGLRARVAAAAEHGLDAGSEMPDRAVRRREAAFAVKPSVVLDAEAADGALVIEASGRDRPGLLHDLARALADLGLSLEAARIDGYGERAVDSFYVTAGGEKPEDAGRQAVVRDALLQVLEEPEAALADRRERTGLAQAAASAGR